MTSVKALTNIEHDGKLYTEGDTLEVTKEQATALAEAGAIETGRAANAQEAEIVSEPTGDGLDELGFDELKEAATAQGIDITNLKSKDALREALRAARD